MPPTRTIAATVPDRQVAPSHGSLRLLLTAAPFFGHVNPLLPLALAARRAGHEVVVATGPDFVDHVAGRGLTAWPIGPATAEAGTPQSLDHFLHTGGQRAEDLLPLVEAWQPDVVVSEELELGGVIAAARHGVHSVVHGLGISATGDSSLVPALDGLGRGWRVTDLAERYRSASYVSICPPSLRPITRVRRPVWSLRPSLGESAGDAGLPPRFAALPFARTIHLTLGTVFHTRRPAVMRAALAGLREMDANVVVTVGPGVDPTTLGRQPDHVLVERYVAHARLLPHCDLVVSQGGAGILFGALAHGLPQLVLPQGADQYANAAAVARAGVGLALDGAAVTPPAIAGAARRLLTEPAFLAATTAVRSEIEAMPSADHVVAAIAALVAGGAGRQTELGDVGEDPAIAR